MKTHTLRLVDKKMSPDGDTCQLFFESENVIEFVEGQFIMLDADVISRGKHRPPKRAYSIGSTMQDMYDNHIISTIVKRTGPGGMSDYLTRHLHIGELMQMMGPYGHMTLPDQASHILLISVGSGITPVYSMYQRLIHTGHHKCLARVYGERTIDQVIPEMITEWAFNQSPHARHRCHLTRADDESLPVGREHGRISGSIDAAVDYVGIANTLVYLCGHPAMVDEMRAKLIDEYDYTKEQIKFEKY